MKCFTLLLSHPGIDTDSDCRLSLVSINLLYLWYSWCSMIETKDAIGRDFWRPVSSLYLKMMINAQNHILGPYFNPDELLGVVGISFVKRNFFTYWSIRRNCFAFSLLAANQRPRTIVQRSVIIGNTARWTWDVMLDRMKSFGHYIVDVYQ